MFKRGRKNVREVRENYRKTPSSVCFRSETTSWKYEGLTAERMKKITSVYFLLSYSNIGAFTWLFFFFLIVVLPGWLVSCQEVNASVFIIIPCAFNDKTHSLKPSYPLIQECARGGENMC